MSTVFDPIKTPTSVAMAETFDELAVVVLQLLRSFKWFHVTLLTDSLASTEFYRQITRATKIFAAQREYSEFHIDAYFFNPTSRESIGSTLKLASKRSRGMADLIF
jgi:hypothetical protein